MTHFTQALIAHRPPADAVSYVRPGGRTSLIIKLFGTDNDRLTRPADQGLWCYTDRLSYRPGDAVRFHTSTSASRYSIEIARVGARREVVWTRAASRARSTRLRPRRSPGAAAGRTASPSGSRGNGGPATTR